MFSGATHRMWFRESRDGSVLLPDGANAIAEKTRDAIGDTSDTPTRSNARLRPTRALCLAPRWLRRQVSAFRVDGFSRCAGFVIQPSCRIDTEAVMGKPYSQDLRERVIAAVDTGTGAYVAALLFQVSVSYIYKALGGRPAK
jgi:hypothetical protein